MTTDFITAMNTAIQRYLPKELWEIAQKFTIPIEFIEKMPDMIALILNSRSMSEQSEKQSRFNLLPLMSDEQIAKLNDILIREKEKLEAIEKKYDEKKLEIKKKYLMKRQNMNYIKKMDVIQETEKKASAQDQQDAENLLDSI